MRRGMKAIVLIIVGAAIGLSGPAQARTLEAIRASGALGLCAHPNSLPFARKGGDPPGFQVELGQVLARELGVSLRLDWIITQYQMRSANCDVLLDVIAAAATPTAAGDFNLTHPDKALRILDRDEGVADLNGNVAVGMVRPDDALREAIDGALERLRNDGTINRIHGRYGVVLQAPR